jgi:hypothetical protein
MHDIVCHTPIRGPMIKDDKVAQLKYFMLFDFTLRSTCIVAWFGMRDIMGWFGMRVY